MMSSIPHGEKALRNCRSVHPFLTIITVPWTRYQIAHSLTLLRSSSGVRSNIVCLVIKWDPSMNCKRIQPGLELSGGWGLTPSQFMSTDAHFWVKISQKLQSLGKISNISAANPQFFEVNSNTVYRWHTWRAERLVWHAVPLQWSPSPHSRSPTHAGTCCCAAMKSTRNDSASYCVQTSHNRSREPFTLANRQTLFAITLRERSSAQHTQNRTCHALQ